MANKPIKTKKKFKYWTDRWDKKHRINGMTDKYLMNCIRMIQNTMMQYNDIYKDDPITLEQVNPKIKDLVKEATNRGILDD